MDAIELRKQLHQHPELSENEHFTSKNIVESLKELYPNRVLEKLGYMKTGVCAEYCGRDRGPTILIRAELDALPIQETNDFKHASRVVGISHKCGHDGHMATLMELAKSLKDTPIKKGRVLLLFQPAEETGTGAQAIVEDPNFNEMGEPDFVYAFHNIPKFPLGQVILRENLFAQASVGFIVNYVGTTSHSSYPENGVSPSPALTQLVSEVNQFAEKLGPQAAGPILGTISYAQLGLAEKGPNFGTAPGEATIMGVLRGEKNSDLQLLRDELFRISEELAFQYRLQFDISWHEAFSATTVDNECVHHVENAAKKLDLPVRFIEQPFRWSEDFGRFTEKYKGAFFGLGAGTDHVQLHDDSYDYPDELIPVGARLYRAIIDAHLT